MQRIGNTSSGTVIIEMNQEEYDALTRLQSPAKNATSENAKATIAEKAGYVKERIIKLKPKKKDGVVHSIAAMFQFTGGIANDEIEKILGMLQKEGFLRISSDGKVSYQ